jgi:flagellar motility protein MotE (MotC chaperone)
MKPVVVAVITFIVGAAGGTGAKVVMTKPLPAKADSLAKSDSTKSDSTKAAGAADSTKVESKTDTAIVQSGAPVKAPDEAAAPATAEKPAAEAESKPEVKVATKSAAKAPATAAAIAAPKTARLSAAAVKLADSAKANLDAKPAAPAAPPAPVIPDTAERRVSKVFTSMDPKQAAKVLEHMSDGDVQIILGYVGVKQAAAIMAALPPERVATLSKLAMRSGGGSKSK